MWFKHPAWIPLAWLATAGNVVATWFAAAPAEAMHATAHAAAAVVFGLGAQYLTIRRQRLNDGSAAEATRGRGLLQADSETLQRVERGVDAMSIELERIGEGQRFLTRVLTESSGKVESLLRQPSPEEADTRGR